MSLKKLFGKHLKSIRQSRGLTQQELAELINLQPNTIGQIEIGYKAVSFSTLEKLAEKLNIDYKEFFNFEENSIRKNGISKGIVNEIQSLDDMSQKYLLSVIKNFLKYKKKI
ncbi:helix-turn-helix transcriptional regulator [bacterium]|nr:helix-turn-helix transcriptional regulator [bacterium]